MKGSKRLGQTIREIRGVLTQRQFAKLICVSQGTVAKYEAGQSFPKAETLCRIAEYGGEAVERILFDSKDVEKNKDATDTNKRVDRFIISNDEIELVIALREMAKHEPEMRALTMSLVYEIVNAVKSKLIQNE